MTMSVRIRENLSAYIEISISIRIARGPACLKSTHGSGCKGKGRGLVRRAVRDLSGLFWGAKAR